MPTVAPQEAQSTPFTKSKRLSQAIVKQITVVSQFPLGYRNREDITNMPRDGVLVVGSQNVLLNTSGRIQVRNGYQMDGTQLFYIQTTAISSNAVSLISTAGITTGDYIQVNFASGITGLTSGSYYYAIAASSTTLGFATSNANALAGTYISISGTPTGASLNLLQSSVNAAILSSYDWNSVNNAEVHMRAGFLDSAGSDGKLQFRYVDSSSNVHWIDIITGLTTVNYNFTSFWDTTELIREALFVNGTPNIFEWSGAYGVVTAVGTSTITISTSLYTTGFYTATPSKQYIKLRGVSYPYTVASGSPMTFTIASGGNPSTGANQGYVGDIVVQTVVTSANTSFAGVNSPCPPATFANGLISTYNNQVFIGSLKSPTVYVSKTNNYLDYGWVNGGFRVPADGATATLDDNLVAFIPQQADVYISAGRNFWYNTNFVQSSSYDGNTAITVESFTITPLKVNPGQGAQSQALTSKMQNYVTMVSFEPVVNQLGLLENILGTPQTKNISDSIKLDFDTYNFSNGSIFYWRWYLFVAVPEEGIVRMFNFNTNAWEAPQTLPISRFYTVNGLLYGHSYVTSESYELFVGYSDRATSLAAGSPYLCVASFGYQNMGTRTTLKNCNEFYIEGYITGNTTLNGTINYEEDGNLTSQTFTVNGDDSTIIGSGFTSNSLGKNSFGKAGLGTQPSTSLTGLPPKFRVIKTFNRFDFYECQFSFSILGVDQNFQLLAFGTNAAPSSTTNSYISE